jgi:hypothetical protein
MFNTQKRNEELIQVRNEQEPVWGSGGISTIAVDSVTGIKAVMMPDSRRYVQGKAGSVLEELAFALVRESEMEKADMIPGKTKIIWNGNTWRILGITDVRNKHKFQNAEISLVRHVGVDGTGTW